ncbi:MAG: NAD-dependent epimerase/dehydratase family protein [Rhodococcus sp.]|nr:NAD-dependent epimerase/dehydratase family protein [Rhodococcus sp. (in: high G+C Gram-positive bacteria)]
MSFKEAVSKDDADQETRVSSLVAVTGADGFIGSHLVEALVRRGHRVRAMAQYNSAGSWGWLDTVEPDVLAEVEVVLGDVRDFGSVSGLMAGASTVYHLAALIAIPYSYVAPRSYLDTNAGGTLNVLEAARALDTQRIVHTSTSEVYGTARTVPISETHPLQAQSPYSASKVAADKLAESYHLSFNLPVVTLRPFNTYGPRQSARAVIPTIMSQIAAGSASIELGDLRPTRDFNFVSDTVAAFMTVGEAPDDRVVGQVLNAGSGREISIGDLVTLIAEVMGSEVEVTQQSQRLRPTGSEVMRLLCDNSRIGEATGWKPCVSLREGLTRTAAWFSEPTNLARYKTGQYSI